MGGQVGIEEAVPVGGDELSDRGRWQGPGDLATGIAIDDEHALDLERPLSAGNLELAGVEGAVAPAADHDDIAGGEGARDRRW